MRMWVIIVLMAGICLFSLDAQAGYNLEQYFPLNRGDSWVYSLTERIAVQEVDSEEKVSAVEVTISGEETENVKEVVRMSVKYEGDANDYFIIKDSAGIKAYKFLEDDGGYCVFDPPVLLLPAQMNEGENVEYSGIATYFDSMGNKRGTEKIIKVFSLTGLEDIKTKAGTFKDCLRIFLKEDFDSDFGEIENNSYTFWLSPEIGKVKEIINTILSRLSNNDNKEFLAKEGTMELEKATVNGKSFGY